MREPDWEALADLQFLLYNRIADSLNAALSSIALSNMPEAQDKPPGFWQERATTKVGNVLNLFNAWSYLIRYKLGEAVPERAVRPFHLNSLLAWLGAQLQITPLPVVASNPLLRANQDTLQEALLLLYSAAYTQGTGVHLELEVSQLGTWFRIKFDRAKPLPSNLDGLITSFGDHWRERDTVFELLTARDFIRLNGGDLQLVRHGGGGEFVFFVRAEGAQSQAIPPLTGVPRAAQPLTEADITHVIKPDALPQETTPPGQTGPLDPDVAARAAPPAPDHAAAPAEPAAPAASEVSTPAPTGAEPSPETEPSAAAHAPEASAPEASAPAPEIPSRSDAQESHDTAGAELIVPPTLADLRPLPAAARGILSLLAPRVEPPGTRRLAPDAASTPTPTLPDMVIVPASIPDPVLPARLRTPPAATSHVALPRETQSMQPIRPPLPADRSTPQPDESAREEQS